MKVLKPTCAAVLVILAATPVLAGQECLDAIAEVETVIANAEAGTITVESATLDTAKSILEDGKGACGADDERAIPILDDAKRLLGLEGT